MLSEDEKRDLLEMASSPALRDQFDQMRRATMEAGKRMDLDSAVAWLSFMNRAFEWKTRPQTPTGSRFLI